MVTQSPDCDDLRALYRRAADAPIATGDRVNDQRVIGFGLIREPEADHMLVEGEEDLSEPRTVRCLATASPWGSPAATPRRCTTFPPLC